ncbi:MAG: hypothetical protein ACI8Y3_000585, partial [Paraglaciecola sp.]
MKTSNQNTHYLTKKGTFVWMTMLLLLPILTL